MRVAPVEDVALDLERLRRLAGFLLGSWRGPLVGVRFDPCFARVRAARRRESCATARRGAEEGAHVTLQEVDVQALDAARLESLVGAERMTRFEEVADAAQASLAGHAVLNVNSTATGVVWRRCCRRFWPTPAGRRVSPKPIAARTAATSN